MARKIPRQWVNMQTGEITLEALQYLDDLENGKDADSPSINTLLSGVNAVQTTTDGIVAGTVPLTDVVISNLGSLTQISSAQSANITAVGTAASAGALTASASPSSLYTENAGPGAITTDTVTVTPSGGTGPYTHAWTYLSGYASFTVSNAAAAAVDFTSLSLNPGQSRSGVWRDTITDSVAATFVVDVAITVVSTE